MTITQTAPLTADTFADLWSQMLRWEATEAEADAIPETDDDLWAEETFDAEEAAYYGII